MEEGGERKMMLCSRRREGKKVGLSTQPRPALDFNRRPFKAYGGQGAGLKERKEKEKGEIGCISTGRKEEWGHTLP